MSVQKSFINTVCLAQFLHQRALISKNVKCPENMLTSIGWPLLYRFELQSKTYFNCILHSEEPESDQYLMLRSGFCWEGSDPDRLLSLTTVLVRVLTCFFSQVIRADQLTAKTAVTERGDLAVFPVSPAFPGLLVLPV